MRPLTLLLLACTMLAGCGDDTHELLVDVRSDLEPGTSFDEILVELRDDRGREVLRSEDEGVLASHDYAGGRRIVEWGEVASGTYVIRVVLRRGGAPVVDVLAEVTLSGDRVISIFASGACAGVVCPAFGDDPAATSCLYGECAFPGCLIGEAEDCPREQPRDAGLGDAGEINGDDAGSTDGGADPDAGAPASDAGPADPALFARWTFDDSPDDRIVEDVTGQGHDLFCDAGECATRVAGVIGSAWDFDGSDDQLRLAYDASLELSRITVLAWVRSHDLTAERSVDMIAGIAHGNGSQNTWELYTCDWETDGVLDLHFGVADANTNDRASTPVSFVRDEWVLLAGTFDDRRARLYVDGVLFDTYDLGRPLRYDGHDLVVGGDENGGNVSSFWFGEIDELRIWERALGDAEIMAIYEAERPSP